MSPHVRALFALLALGCSPSGAGAPLATAAAEPSRVELLFHEPTGQRAPRDACDTELCRSLLTLIDSATERIDLAVYGVRGQTAVLQALRRARDRGVRIRAVVDREVDGSNVYRDTDLLLPLVERLASDQEADLRALEAERARPRRAARPRCAAPPGRRGPVQCLAYPLADGTCLTAAHASREPLERRGAIMHHKFFVVDGRRLWTGSTNVSDSCTGGYNANLVVRVDDPTVAGWYTREFEELWAGRFHGEKRSQGPMLTRVGDVALHVLFSPQDAPMQNAVRPLLRQARRRIDVAAFFLTDKWMTADLIGAHERGVQVRVLLDATGASNGYSKHELLRAVGIPVKVEDWGGKLHMKSLSVDGTWVVAGSMNFTSAGEAANDENTLVLRSTRIATQHEAFFERLWSLPGDRWLREDPDPESPDSGGSCADGVDNDHDDAVDARDPGCSATPPPREPSPGWRRVPLRDGVCDHDAAEPADEPPTP